MVAVFAVFATLSSLDIKQMGVGLAVAVLLDATIVRAVLLPSTMKLLGDWNWYLPRWLEWLPTVSLEGPAPATPPGPAAAAAVAPGSPLRIQTRHSPDRVTMVLGGELDLRSSRSLERALREAERERPALVVIDLRGLDFMDSTGLSQLVRATKRARDDQRRVVLVTGTQPIDRILVVSGVQQALETTADPATLDN
jgi:RND superfamily putative drug exporter